MIANSLNAALRLSNDNGFATAERRAIVSSKLPKRDKRKRIATLEAETLRYKTAIDNISHGVCIFDDKERLRLCNRGYAQLYRLSPEQLRPRAPLRELLELHAAAGAASKAGIDSYLAFSRSIKSDSGLGTWTAELEDGRTIRVSTARCLAEAGWLATRT